MSVPVSCVARVTAQSVGAMIRLQCEINASARHRR